MAPVDPVHAGAREEAAQAAKEITGGEGADVVLETAGTVEPARQAQEMVRRGGALVLVGMFAEQEFPLYVMDIIFREYDVRGVFRYLNCFPPALALLEGSHCPSSSLFFDRVTRNLCRDLYPRK